MLSHNLILFFCQVRIQVAVAPLNSSFDLIYSPTGVVVDVLNLVFSHRFAVFKSDLKDIIGIRAVCPEIR